MCLGLVLLGEVNLRAIFSPNQYGFATKCGCDMLTRASTILALKVFSLYDLINKNRGISIPWTEWGCNRKLVVMLLLSLALKFRFLSVPILIISISSFSIPSVSFARASVRVA